jgi:Cof subfamily protein (haloacid dehalogenase superfamily)
MDATATRPGPPLRLLVLDVDGTVTDDRHQVPAATRLAVQTLREAGIRVMLATGRRYRDALPIAVELGLDTPMVTASGALVKHPADHATLARAAFAPGVLDRTLGTIVDRGHEPILYGDSFAEGFDFYCRRLDFATSAAEGVAEYLARNAGLARVRADLHRAPPPDVFAGFAMGSQAEMKALEAALHAACPGSLSIHTLRSPRYGHWMCEIAPTAVTKWTGIETVARGWGIGPTEICAAGDDVNDVPMIRAAGLGVAMGNARREVIEVADLVVGRNDGSGITDIANLMLARLAQPAPPR